MCISQKTRLIPRRQYAVSEDCVCIFVSMRVFWLRMCVRDDRAAVPRGKTDTNSHHCRGFLGESKLSLALSMPASLSLTIWLETHTHTHAHNTHFINLSHSLPPSLLLSLSPKQNLATVFPHHTHSFPITRQVAAVPRQ